MRYKLVLPVLAVICTACIIVPLTPFTDAPYPPELLAGLSSGGADKGDVRKALGPPRVTRDGGEYWFYATIREVAGILGGTSGAVIDDYEWVALQFNAAGRVVFAELGEDASGCLSNGICHIRGLFSNDSSVVLTAPSGEDAAARDYAPGSDVCAVYFYQVPALQFRAVNIPVALSVDGRDLGTINYETYLFFTHAPGDVRLGAYQFRIAVKCRGGEKLYVRILEAAWSVTSARDMAPVSVAEGLAAIRERRLALLN